MKTKELFLNRFNLIRELGEGSYGTVALAEDMVNENLVALKVIQKSSILKMAHINRLRREINLLRLLKHPNVVRLFEVIETFDQLILVMEYVSGGDLFDLIMESKRLDEQLARKIFRQLFSAIMYCHHNMMVHRDLKPENLLLDENQNLKIIDFGFVRTFSNDPNLTLKTYCGSLYYCAPEMLDGTPYPGPSSDIWSLGVILYVLTNGYLPFRDTQLPKLYGSLKAAKYDKGEYSSPECNRLIEKMLVSNPADRMSLKDLANDPWLNEGYDSMPSPFSELTNDLLRFRELVSKKIEVLESQEIVLENEFKENGLKVLSLIIPIGDEDKPLVLDQFVRRSASEISEYQSEPIPKQGDWELKPRMPVCKEESRNASTMDEFEKKSIAAIEENEASLREYSSCPVRTEPSKNSQEEFNMNIEPGKVKENNWKLRISNWFQRVDHGSEPVTVKTHRRFSLFLKK